LTVIKGIGPVAAGQLNEQGIMTFAQIAKLSDKDVAKIDEHMPFSADQIMDWREQAKELVKK
ncbi:MAG: 50S ribosomal protein L21, partial [Mesorhizobium sp.]